MIRHLTAAIMLLLSAGNPVLEARIQEEQTLPTFRSAPGGLTTPLESNPSPASILDVNGGGVALLDVDGDGDPDVLFAHGAGRDDGVTLLINDGTGTLTRNNDHTDLDGISRVTGILTADLTGNGREDVLLTRFGENVLLRQEETGRFSRLTIPNGSPAWSTSASAADFDRDGFLDIFVTNYLVIDPDQPPDHAIDGLPCLWKGQPVFCGPQGLTPVRDVLYRNDGSGGLVDVTEESGIQQTPAAFGLGTLATDLDEDGLPDIYVANDSVGNHMFWNGGESGVGTFFEDGLRSGLALSASGRAQAGMGVDAADIDHDGDQDIIVTNFSGEPHALYRNDGQRLFTESSHTFGIFEPTLPLLSFGCALADLDSDGDADLVTANGHVYPEADAADSGTRYRQPLTFFLNQKGLMFDQRKLSGTDDLNRPRLGRGLTVGDLDSDGHQDLVITHLDGPPIVLLNNGNGGNGLLLDLRRAGSGEQFATGARVEYHLGDTQRTVFSRRGQSFQSTHGRRLHLGLGASDHAGRVLVTWPDGSKEELGDLEAGWIYLVRQGEGLAEKQPLNESTAR